MTIKKVFDAITSFIIDPGNKRRKPSTRGLAWAVTIILGIGTLGIMQGVSALWRKLRHIEKNETHEKTGRFFQKSVPKNNKDPEQPVNNPSIQPIASNFTVDKSIAEQRQAHNNAKEYLLEEATKIGADVVFVSPINSFPCPKVDEVQIKKDLDPAIFTWEKTEGVQGDIQKDGKRPDQVVLYGVASQFNACEAVMPFTPKPGTAVETYKGDPTQGPGAQLQFPDQQVEIINNAANLGFNGLCQVLDNTTKMAIKHGYLTPRTKELAEAVIEQLKKNGDKMEFPCIGNIPKGENTERVYEMLVAAPAFGMYSVKSKTTNAQKKEIEFLCALHGYRAQFQQVIQLAASTSEKQVIFKPTAPGLGVFGNRVTNVAKAFYVAAKECENELIEKNIHVRLQVFHGEGDTKMMATILGLSDKANR